MEIKLSLTLDEVNAVLDGLNQLPHRIAAVPFAKIKQQAQFQLAEEEKAAKAKAAKETKKGN
jgi:hypothetical protein